MTSKPKFKLTMPSPTTSKVQLPRTEPASIRSSNLRMPTPVEDQAAALSPRFQVDASKPISFLRKCDPDEVYVTIDTTPTPNVVIDIYVANPTRDYPSVVKVLKKGLETLRVLTCSLPKNHVTYALAATPREIKVIVETLIGSGRASTLQNATPLKPVVMEVAAKDFIPDSVRKPEVKVEHKMEDSPPIAPAPQPTDIDDLIPSIKKLDKTLPPYAIRVYPGSNCGSVYLEHRDFSSVWLCLLDEGLTYWEKKINNMETNEILIIGDDDLRGAKCLTLMRALKHSVITVPELNSVLRLWQSSLSNRITFDVFVWGTDEGINILRPLP